MPIPKLPKSAPSARKRRAPRPAQGLEVLEDKVLLSNVTVRIRGNNIIINGDADANDISISTGFEGEGPVVIESFNGDTINGEASPFVHFFDEEVGAGNIKVNLKNGDDTVTLEGSDIGGNVVIKGGSGDDYVVVADVVIGGHLRINTASGSDAVGVIATDIGRSLKINTGSDSDKVFVYDTYSYIFEESRSRRPGRASINTGSDDDLVVLLDSEFEGNFSVNTGSGSDYVLTAIDVYGRLVTKLGSGDDIHRSILDDTGDAFITDGGSGDDEMSLEAYDFLFLDDINGTSRGYEYEDIFEGEGEGIPDTPMYYEDVDLVFDCVDDVFGEFLDFEGEGEV